MGNSTFTKSVEFKSIFLWPSIGRSVKVKYALVFYAKKVFMILLKLHKFFGPSTFMVVNVVFYSGGTRWSLIDL